MTLKATVSALRSKAIRLPVATVLIAASTALISSSAVAYNTEQADKSASTPLVTIAVPPPPVLLPAPEWQTSHINDLRGLIRQAKAEGLDPSRYDDGALAALTDAADSTARAAVARPVAVMLARDFHQGIQAAKASMWKLRPEVVDYDNLVDTAVRNGQLGQSIRALLPASEDYARLRGAYAPCLIAHASYCDTLKINLDRWRAMPRETGAHHVWVNVPAYTLHIVDNGTITQKHRVIVGKLRSPTLQFTANATAVTFNPWWTIPSSIVAESVGKLVRNRPAVAAQRGYVVTQDANGRSVYRQRPGPSNSLGQLKIEMPNPYAIFLHDTPSRGLFNNTARAYSHGCVRVENPLGLALSLLGASTDEAAAKELLSKRTNKTIRLEQPVPVYFVYFTAVPDPDRIDRIIYYPDIYKQDPVVKTSQKLIGTATECSAGQPG